MAPWWLRQLAVFGSISPSSASGKVFFIRDIAEWNSISTPATLDHLLGMGPGPLLATRIGGLIAALMIYVTLVAGFVLAPFMVIGGWARRRSVDFGPFFVYAGLLFAFSAPDLGRPRPRRHVHHHSAAVALAPHSSSSPSKGSSWPSGGSPRVAERGTRHPPSGPSPAPRSSSGSGPRSSARPSSMAPGPRVATGSRPSVRRWMRPGHRRRIE